MTKNLQKHPLFSQYEFEAKLNAILAFGDEKAIADEMGVSATIISQMFNPHDERISWVARAAQIICALDTRSTARGDEVINLIQCTRARRISTLEKYCLKSETNSLHKEFSEFLQSHLEGKEKGEQLKELVDVEEQVKREKQALTQEILEREGGKD